MQVDTFFPPVSRALTLDQTPPSPPLCAEIRTTTTMAAARDWIRERVDIGLLADDLPQSNNDSASPFECTFTNQNGQLSEDHVQAQTQAFQRFCDAGEEGDTLIFFAHADSYTEKIPRKDAIAARDRKLKAKADAMNAQAEAQKKSEDENKDEEGNALPNAAADEAALKKESTSDTEDEPLYDLVTKERFRYRCVTAKQLEEMVLNEIKQTTVGMQGTSAAAQMEAGGETKETAQDIMAAMQNGVVYFVRKTSDSFSKMMSAMQAKQLGINESNSSPTVVRDLSMATKVEWGCLRGLSVHNLTHLNSCIHSVFLPFLDGMMTDKAAPAAATATSSVPATPAAPSVAASKVVPPPAPNGDSASSSGSGSGFWSHAVEFRSQMSKFKGQLDSAIQQTRGRVSLPMRLEIALDEENIDQAAADFETFRALEEMLGEWTEVVKDVVAQSQRAQPTGRGPMAEIEFWRHQHGMLSAMYEQLSSDRALMVVHILKVAGSTLLDDYHVNHSELTRLHVEAADNVKFLATLERHFKNIENGSGDLRTIEETLDSMMNGLRMVWIISRHYNTDERMVNLMERIADSIAEVITSRIDTSTILRWSGSSSSAAPTDSDMAAAASSSSSSSSSSAANRFLIGQAKNVLDKWQDSYLKTRKLIEIATPQHRWEFHTEKKTLFERTNYMSTVCRDLIHVVDVVTQFRMFLGPDLKEVTGKSDEIDRVIQEVERSIVPLETTPFSVFNYSCHTSWKQLMNQFNEQVVILDKMCHSFLDTAFNSLRSAEGAFEVLQRFQDMESRKSIQKQLMEKFDAVLVRYGEEVTLCSELFEQHSKNSTVLIGKNQPPVAGAIAYASSLYRRAKKPIMRFIQSETLKSSPLWESEREKYLNLARKIDSFCSTVYDKWVRHSTNVVTRELSEFILGPKPHEIRDEKDRRVVVLPVKKKWYVNFSSHLSELIREAKYLDRLGYTVPDSVLNVALQGDIYTTNIVQLNQMLQRYEEEMSALSPVERNLFAKPINELHRFIEPGFNVLNWSSLNIPLFISRANKATENFRSVLRRVRKSSDGIDAFVKQVSTTNLIQERDFTLLNLDQPRHEAMDFYFKMDKRRTEVLEDLTTRGDSLSSLFIQIERLVSMTDTGRSPDLHSYYIDCERRIYNAICEMIIRSIATLQSLLNINTSGSVTENDDDNNYNSKNASSATPALIQLRATISKSSGDVQVTPELSECLRHVRKALDSIVKSASVFKRFEHGSCHHCRPVVPAKIKPSKSNPITQSTGLEEEPYQYTMYEDVANNPVIVSMIVSTQSAIHVTQQKCKRYLDNWKKYDRTYGLWDTSKMKSVSKGDYSAHSTVFFDGRLSGYDMLSSKVKLRKTKLDIDFIHLDCYPCSVTVRMQSQKWKVLFGGICHAQVRKRLNALMEKLKGLKNELLTEPTDLDKFKYLLSKIREVDEMGMDTELEMKHIIETMGMLRKYGIIKYTAFPGEEGDDANEKATATAGGGEDDLILGGEYDKTIDELKMDNHEWLEVDELIATFKSLVGAAKTLEMRQVKLKEDFCETTKKDVIVYASEIKVQWRKMKENGPGSSGAADDLEKGLEMLEESQQILNQMEKKRLNLVSAERLFDLPNTEYIEMNAMKKEIDDLNIIYGLYMELQQFSNSQSGTLWSQLNIKSLLEGATFLDKKATKLKKTIQPTRSILEAVVNAVGAFKDSLPLIEQLKNPAMKPRHWNELMKLTGVKFNMDPKTFKLRNIFAMNLARFGDEVSKIAYKAGQELKIETQVATLKKYWKSCEFTVRAYTKDGVARGFVLGSTEEIKVDLDDQLLNLTSIGGSRFVGPFLAEVSKWSKSLNNVLDCIDEWFKVQQKWQYLESIFVGSEDIRMQLPEAAKNFDRIDKAFKDLMKGVNSDSNVLSQCEKPGRLDELVSYTERLDRCQKSLSDYLETKRNIFPRFYFISDDELLSILGSSDPLSVQIHMAKMFANCRQLFFINGGKKVVGMQSAKREQYDMRTPVSTDAVVEDWLCAVELEMQDSLRAITKEAVFNYGGTVPGGGNKLTRIDWINSVVGMVSIMGTQTWWTWEVEDAFTKVEKGDKYAVKRLLDRLGGQVNELINKTRDMSMTSHMRKKVGCLIILDVHGRDIVDGFVRDSILDERAFEWESQLRFYWDLETDDVRIKQCTGVFPYGYEYQGLNGRLVITPLTDRIVMTLTQALTFHLGGAPAGPAGTGKTETVKDLAKTMGLPCFVTNCGEGLDYKAVGAIFSGLAAAGAWGCFDEFNRINVEVLSVVSAQLKNIQTALHLGQKKRDIGMGREIRIRVTVGIFITMNPGYAGRTELPDNLKALFRPIAVIVPDMGAIAEIMLMSEGFNKARVLGRKMTVLYKLAGEQLSKQYHYGFGLREMKTVLVMAGSLKRSERDLTEDVILMRALRDMNMPKFIFDDVPLFLALIQDLFPNLSAPRVGYKELVAAITNDLEQQGYKHSDEEVFKTQVDKIVQLYETMIVRHTSQVVGPPGGGKTVVIETLKRALLPAFGIQIKTNVLNPKAIELYELYGFMDPVTRDWTDGILSNLFRDMNQPLPVHREGKERHWLLFDGDVDAEWVENMNSVMDDNRLLTLPNGERIQLKDFSKLIIETYDLQFASPATISRCGMVWVDPKFLGYRPYWEKWVTEQLTSLTVDMMGGVVAEKTTKDEDDDEEEEEEEEEGDSTSEKFQLLKDLFDKYVPKCIDLVLEGIKDGEMLGDEDRLKQVVPISDLSIIKQLCSLLHTILVHNDLELSQEDEGNEGDSEKINEAFGEPDQIEGVFVFCLMWACGGALIQESRIKLNDLITNIYVEGSGKELFEHIYNPEERRWEKWEERVPSYKQPMPFKFYQVVVPTADSVMYTYLLDRAIAGNKPCLLVGEPGTAKTTIVQNYLFSQPPTLCKRLEINLSSRTSARDVQNNIEDNTEKKSGKIYGAPAGKKLVVFIDDMNMPKVDHYGTQQPIALLLFLIGRNLMYRLGKDVELLSYRDMRYIGAMGPPGGGRNPTDPRFVSRFVTFNLTPPSEEILQNIFQKIIVNYYDQPTFKSSVKDCTTKMVKMLLNVYTHVQERLPPTPSKFHYIFTIRDVGRVIEGCCLATPDKFIKDSQVIRLWRNECTRLFCDRLTTAEDINVVSLKIEEQINDHFGSIRDEVMKDPLVFGDFSLAIERLRTDEGDSYEDPQLYEDQGTYVEVRKTFDDALEEYNILQKPMSLVLFQSALEHLTRVYRIMRLDRGNAMLVGFGGSGKQSMTKLATFTAGYDLFEITLVRGYGLEEFKEDIKGLYKILTTGPAVMLFTDAHVVDESFMEVLNNMLTTGMVPALFESDEKDGVCNSVRAEVAALGIPETNENCWTHFVNKCRSNLHIVLAMSPAGDTLRIRCRSFPGMVSNTVIDWYYPWPPEALEAVATYFLQEEKLPEEHRTNIVQHMVIVHQSMMTQMDRFLIELRRHMYVTPKNFLDYISNYRSGMKAARHDNARQTRRLSGGLAKLVEAAEAVAVMSGELKKKKVIVDAATIDCQKMIKEIQEKTKVADEQKIVALAKEEELTEMAGIIEVESAKAQEQLGEALPALEMAAEALKNLNKADIGEVKQFTTPPEKVQSVVMCVMILKPGGKEKESDGWKGGKVMMGEGDFLKKLQNYDKDKVTASMARKVKQYYRDPSFTPDGMKAVSKAAAGMLTWVVAIVKYYDVAKNVEPLRKRVRQLEKDQAKGNAELKNLKEQLTEITQLLNTLGIAYEKSSGELESLTTEANTMERKLNAATKLINGLSSERSRWTGDLSGLSDTLTKVVGDRLLSSGFLSYVGAFDSVFRKRVIEGIWMPDIELKKIPLTLPYDLSKQLVSGATKQQWVSEGLPADKLSVQNGILTTVASRFPLCIDPQEQAVSWIKRKHKDDQLIVKTFNDGDFIKHMELAITYGRPFLFEKVENYIDPVIDPILEKLTYQQSGQTYIKLGDKAIEWDVNFVLYMTSKLANPHYSPEVSGKCIVINYSVTMKGLENQLLNVVVGKERPDLEKKYADLVVEMSASNALLLKLEDTLLRELSNSTGDILDNEELIATLDNTKTKAVEISAKLEQAKFTEAEINKSRAQYTSAAKRGSILFFTIAGLSTISKMYTISLGSFLQVFKSSLATSTRDVNLDNRLKNIINESTVNTYDYACTGIFENHKLMFSMQLTTMIMDGDGTLDRNELNFFLKGDTSLDEASEVKPVHLEWLLDSGWKNLIKLSTLKPVFENILVDIKTKAPQEWRDWYDLEDPENVDLPCGYSKTVSPMQSLLILRCFRPDRVYNAVKLFIIKEVGDRYVQPPTLNYENVFKQSAAEIPVIFVLSPGADPQSSIEKLADEKNFTSKFKFLSLGQGQDKAAEALMTAGSNRGHWVLLQNCHLLSSWLPRLSAFLEAQTNLHNDYRLWLTTNPTNKFPLGILQRSLKVVTEPPDGLKLNMRSSYAAITESVLNSCDHPAYRPLMYVLSFYHAVVQERRKYGKIGWNVRYDFNDSDIEISQQLLRLYLNKSYEYSDGDARIIPWGAIKYLIGDAMYGGRVTDDFDRRVLRTYLNEYMGDFLFDTFQTFYFSKVGFDYTLPGKVGTKSEVGVYRDMVETLPLINPPGIFGLHANAEISYLNIAADDMWRNLIDLQPRIVAGGGGMSREEHISATARDIQNKVPKEFDLMLIAKQIGLNRQPAQIVLLQELERWNKLVVKMSRSLSELQKALVGEIGMSDALDELGAESK